MFHQDVLQCCSRSTDHRQKSPQQLSSLMQDILPDHHPESLACLTHVPADLPPPPTPLVSCSLSSCSLLITFQIPAIEPCVPLNNSLCDSQDSPMVHLFFNHSTYLIIYKDDAITSEEVSPINLSISTPISEALCGQVCFSFPFRV